MAEQTTAEDTGRANSENSSHGSEKRDSADRAEVSNYEIVQHHFCAAITWWCYVRQREVAGRRPVLGEARA